LGTVSFSYSPPEEWSPLFRRKYIVNTDYKSITYDKEQAILRASEGYAAKYLGKCQGFNSITSLTLHVKDYLIEKGVKVMGLDFKVTRLHKFDGRGAVKAVCDVSISDEFVVKGFRIVEGKKGLFVGVPQEPGKDGKWYNNAFPLTAEARTALNKAVLAAYKDE
jgi:stage V sporulation protein G